MGYSVRKGIIMYYIIFRICLDLERYIFKTADVLTRINKDWVQAQLAFGAKSVEIPVGVTVIEAGAFWGCKELLEVSIPNTVVVIENKAFEGCENLRSINIPNSVTTIGKKVFYNCRSLASVGMTDSVKEIGDCAFSYCVSLRYIVLSSCLTVIKERLFSGSGVREIKIPTGVVRIEKHAFWECFQLETVELSNMIEEIEEFAFSKCHALHAVKMSKNLRVIDSMSFYACSQLRELDIPDSVEKIGYCAFGHCGFHSISIPGSVDIGMEVLESCVHLSAVIVRDVGAVFMFNPFNLCNALVSLEVPCDLDLRGMFFPDNLRTIVRRGRFFIPKLPGEFFKKTYMGGFFHSFKGGLVDIVIGSEVSVILFLCINRIKTVGLNEGILNSKESLGVINQVPVELWSMVLSFCSFKIGCKGQASRIRSPSLCPNLDSKKMLLKSLKTQKELKLEKYREQVARDIELGVLE